MKICPACNYENPDTNKFCNYCGAQLSGVEPTGNTEPEPDPLAEILAKQKQAEQAQEAQNPVGIGAAGAGIFGAVGQRGHQPAQQGGFQPGAQNGFQPAGQRSHQPGAQNGFRYEGQGYQPGAQNGFQAAGQGGYQPGAQNGFQYAGQGGYQQTQQGGNQPVQRGGYQPGARPAGQHVYRQMGQGGRPMAPNNNAQQYTYSPTPFDSKIPEIAIGKYVAWSVFDILFSLVFGILGLVFVLRINKSKTVEEQQKNLKTARIFLIIGTVLAILNIVIMIGGGLA